MLKKIVLLLVLIVFISTGCGVKEPSNDIYQSIIKKDKVTIGISFDSKPFGYVDSDGVVKGVDADIAKEISKRILGSEKKVEFKQVTPQTRIQAVTTGAVDMVIASMTITPQRLEVIDFSDPYFIAGQAICVKKDSDINSYHDLNNRNVVVILGTTGEKNLRYFAPNAIMQGYLSNSDAFAAFKGGGSDAITTDDSLLLGFVMENDGYELLPKRLTKEPYGIAFKKDSDAASLKSNINRILGEMKFDGTIENIKDKWGV